MAIIFLVMIANQWPLIILKSVNNLVLMTITLTACYVYSCLLFQDTADCVSFGFSLRSKSLNGLSFRPLVDV